MLLLAIAMPLIRHAVAAGFACFHVITIRYTAEAATPLRFRYAVITFSYSAIDMAFLLRLTPRHMLSAIFH